MNFKDLMKRRQRLKKYAHFVAGFVILIHAYEKYESGHGSYLSFTIAGLIVLSIAILHSVIEKKAPWIDGVFFVIEGILSIIIALDFFHMGKKALPYTYLALSLFQFFVAFRKSRKGIAKHKSSHGVKPIEEEQVSSQ